MVEPESHQERTSQINPNGGTFYKTLSGLDLQGNGHVTLKEKKARNGDVATRPDTQSLTEEEPDIRWWRWGKPPECAAAVWLHRGGLLS